MRSADDAYRRKSPSRLIRLHEILSFHVFLEASGAILARLDICSFENFAIFFKQPIENEEESGPDVDAIASMTLNNSQARNDTTSMRNQV